MRYFRFGRALGLLSLITLVFINAEVTNEEIDICDVDSNCSYPRILDEILDAEGRPLQQIYENGVTKNFVYDVNGNLIEKRDNEGTTQFEYDSNNRKVKEIESDSGYFVEYIYDAEGRQIGIQSSLGERVEIEHIIDSSGYLGNRKKMYDEMGQLFSTELVRVNDGLVTLKQTVPNNSYVYNTSYKYDEDGNVTQVSQNGGGVQETFFKYDDRGNLLAERLVEPGQIDRLAAQYTYDESNRITSVTDGLGNQSIYNYFDLDNVLSVVNNDFGSVKMLIDPQTGRVVEKTDGNDVSVRFNYNFNEMSRIGFPSGDDIVIGFNSEFGKVESISDNSSSVVYSYNANRKISRITATIENKSYTTDYKYRPNGQLEQIIYPSGLVVNYI